MNILFDKGNVSGVLTVKMVKADYEENVKKAIKDISRKAQMPGFRPGKVPATLVKKMYGTQAKAEEVNKLLSDKLFEYIRENKINMLGEPLPSEQQTTQDIEQQDDFEFVFDIALAPEFKATLSGDDEIAYYDIEVSDADVDEQVKQFAGRAGHPEEVEHYEDRDVLRGILAELNAEGQPLEGGIQVENVSLMPTYFKNEDQKALFADAAKNDVIVFCPAKAYEGNDAEIAAVMKIQKEEVGAHGGDFSFQVESISRFAPAKVDQELFNQVFGEGEVKSEEEFRSKIKQQMSEQRVADSDYKFLLDVRAHMEQKVGELQLPEDLLKRIMKANNSEKPEDYVEKNFAKSIEELKWHLIKEQLVEANGIKVDDKDVKATAIQASRFQFAQYGMTNIPDEYLEQYAAQMLKNKDQVNGLVERCIDAKLSAALKTVVTLQHKSISAEDFGKMF